MKYICECGKEFENVRKLNGHKGHCDIYLTNHDKLRERDQRYLKISKSIKKIAKERSTNKKLNEITKWISEKHVCEKCGKIMTEKYGSGRFCSRACANSRIQTEEINLKRRLKLKGRVLVNSKGYERTQKARIKYYKNPKICPICGKILEFNIRSKKLCSKECLHIYRQQIASKNEHGNYGGFISKNKKISYKNAKLDSNYELLVAQDLDKNGVVWTRPKYFLYEMDGKQHRYTPDFYLPEYDIYLDPKNDYLINNINPSLGYNDVEKIEKVSTQNNVKILILDVNSLTWDKIKQKIEEIS